MVSQKSVTSGKQHTTQEIPTSSNKQLIFCCRKMLLVEWQEGYLACKKTEWWDAGVVPGQNPAEP